MTAEAILVTGLSGLIGGAVARRLADAGKTVVGMDRVAPVNAYFPVIVHDLPDPQRWHEAIVRYGVRKVVHAGGISGPMLLQDAPARLCDINIGGLLGLLEAARIHRLERIVWFSSILAYGDRADLSPVTEDTPLRPNTIYGATKAGGEALIEAFHAEHGVDAVSLRVASCYGPGRTTACLMRTLVEDGLDGKTTVVRDAAGRTRQHVFIDDVVDAVCAALDAKTLTRRAYNIGPGIAQDLDDIAEAVRSAVPGTSVALRPDGLVVEHFRIGPARDRCRTARSFVRTAHVAGRGREAHANLGGTAESGVSLAHDLGHPWARQLRIGLYRCRDDARPECAQHAKLRTRSDHARHLPHSTPRVPEGSALVLSQPPRIQASPQATRRTCSRHGDRCGGFRHRPRPNCRRERGRVPSSRSTSYGLNWPIRVA